MLNMGPILFTEQLREHLLEVLSPHAEIGVEHLIQLPVHRRQKIIAREIAGFLHADTQTPAALPAEYFPVK